MKTHLSPLLLAVAALWFAGGAAAHADRNTDTLVLRYCRWLAGTDKALAPCLERIARFPRETEVSDQNVVELQQRYPVAPGEARRLARSLRADGTWPDIDYASRLRSGWAPKDHVERIHTLARYHYARPDTLVAAAIHRAIGYWIDRRPVCQNWWYNEIGVPRTLGQAALLFAPRLTEAERRGIDSVMGAARFGRTGQNPAWLAGNVLLRALLAGDTATVRRARDEIADEIVSGRREGIQPDWSFHQHGPQPQWGNYGLSFLSGMAFYAELFDRTPYAFSPRQTALLDSLLTEGFRWTLWRGRMDINALGRQLFRRADRDKALTLVLAAQSLKHGETETATGRTGTATERSKAATGRPATTAAVADRLTDENLMHPGRPSALTGYRHFPCSDQTYYRTAHWMASVRMASQRVVGTELINEDNLQGFYMADGALFVYARGDEYADAFPLWNWRCIPGTTTPDTTGAIPRRDARNRSRLVGGCPDGDRGITAMELNRDGVHARKAWVFTPDGILCLGADVRSDRHTPLVTTVDQRRRRTRVWHRGRRWHHDGTGYVVLHADSLDARTEHRRGRWHDVMGMYRPEWTEGDLFTLTLHHAPGRPEGYAYVVLPGASRRRTRRFSPATFRIVRNDALVQAVCHAGRYYVAAYAPARLAVDCLDLDLSRPGTFGFDTAGRAVRSAVFETEE